MVEEGGAPDMIVIRSNVPPMVYCRAGKLDDSCTVFVQLKVTETDPVRCPQGELCNVFIV